MRTINPYLSRLKKKKKKKGHFFIFSKNLKIIGKFFSKFTIIGLQNYKIKYSYNNSKYSLKIPNLKIIQRSINSKYLGLFQFFHSQRAHFPKVYQL